MRFATGQPVPRTEDPRLLTGKGRYADDVNLFRQAHAVMLRSPHAHAEIKGIDMSAAEAMPGVVAILTGEDYAADGLGYITGGAPHKKRDGSPMFRPPRPALTRDRVRHVGQAVAVIVAETVAQAKDAAEAVVVDYAPLPANVLTGAARGPGTPAIWDECPDNELFLFKSGNAEKTEAAFANAAHIVKHKFVVNRITANTLEPRAATGVYDSGDDRYTIYTGSQRPWAWRSTLTKNLFKIGEHQLTFVTGDLGGSFGMKGAIYPEVPLVAWASKRIGGRPVKWTCERSEGLSADDHARDNITEAQLALDKDGKFLALKVESIGTVGAYVSYLGFGPPTGNTGGLVGVYDIPAAYVTVSGVFTNTSPLSPYRGAGRPEASFVIENLIDLAARETGIERSELRRRNFIAPEQMPYKTALTFTYDSGEFEPMMQQALDNADYTGFESRREEARSRGKIRGMGISCTIEQSAAPQTETAEMRFDPSGHLTLLVGTTQHGQGHETIYKQLVAERLGMAPEQMRLIEGDTDKVSFGTGTGGSRSATIGTSAVSGAIDKVIDKATRIAAHILEAAEADIALEDGKFKVAGTDRAVAFKDVAMAAFEPSKLPKGMEVGLYETSTYLPPAPNFPNGCHICEVEIDPDTGRTEIVSYTVVDDVGFELNPMLVKGQIHGGIAQGAGQALMENIAYDPESGQLISGSFMDYAMPRADDFCDFKIASRPVPTLTNPLGVKGAGEAGTVGALPSVMNAIADALAPLGIRHLDMPATPERVWQAIRAASGGK